MVSAEYEELNNGSVRRVSSISTQHCSLSPVVFSPPASYAVYNPISNSGSTEDILHILTHGRLNFLERIYQSPGLCWRDVDVIFSQESITSEPTEERRPSFRIHMFRYQ